MKLCLKDIKENILKIIKYKYQKDFYTANINVKIYIKTINNF